LGVTDVDVALAPLGRAGVGEVQFHSCVLEQEVAGVSTGCQEAGRGVERRGAVEVAAGQDRDRGVGFDAAGGLVAVLAAKGADDRELAEQ
jgi:hypothetical protein